jgi:hypothetical protein
MADRVAVPSSFGRRATWGIVAIAVGLLGLALSIAFDPTPSVVFGPMYVLFGTGVVVWALVVRRRPALVLDDEGIRDGAGELLAPWSQAALVWVGEPVRGLPFGGSSPNLYVWTAASLDYARRTGFVPNTLLYRTVPTPLGAEQIAELIRGFARCPVRSGDGTALRRLTQAIRSADAPDPRLTP